MLLLLLGLFISHAAAQSATPSREWTSTDGRKMQAAFVAMRGTDLVLRLADGKQISVPLERFSQQDQEHLADMIIKNPAIALQAAQTMPKQPAPTPTPAPSAAPTPAAAPTSAPATPQNYRFNVTWDKVKMLEAPANIGAGYAAKVTTWKPIFKVTNQCGRQMDSVELAYQVQISLDRNSNQRNYSFLTGKVQVPVMKPNQTVEVMGSNFQTLEAKVLPNYRTTDRSSRTKSDTILGTVVKLAHNQRLVHQFKAGTAVQDILVTSKLRELGVALAGEE